MTQNYKLNGEDYIKYESTDLDFIKVQIISFKPEKQCDYTVHFVGSSACEKCGYYISTNKNGNFVRCKHL